MCWIADCENRGNGWETATGEMPVSSAYPMSFIMIRFGSSLKAMCLLGSNVTFPCLLCVEDVSMMGLKLPFGIVDCDWMLAVAMVTV